MIGKWLATGGRPLNSRRSGHTLALRRRLNDCRI
jgi:hypothetical protein